MTSTAIALPLGEDNGTSPETIKTLIALEQAGALTPVSLDLSDPDMPYVRWESLGRFFGGVVRANLWWVGDWLIYGEAVFGEQAAQGVEATTKERYSEAERVTGFDHGTLMNIRSICARVTKPYRRKELGFWIHQEVASLDPAEQAEWLQKAIDTGLNQKTLREAIRQAKNPTDDDDADGDGDGGAGKDGMSIGERVEEAARLVLKKATNDSHGDWIVPNTAMAQLRAALGEE